MCFDTDLRRKNRYSENYCGAINCTPQTKDYFLLISESFANISIAL